MISKGKEHTALTLARLHVIRMIARASGTLNRQDHV
jgi:hypothetical protein